MKNILFRLLMMILLFGGSTNSPALAGPPISKLKMPAGFKASIFCQDVPGARQMALGDKGILFVGTIVSNNVYALPDMNKDGKADRVIIIAKNLNHPNGVAFKDGALYVAEINRILKYENIESVLINSNFKKAPKAKVITKSLPKDEWHGYRYIRFGPDGDLYVPIGAPCNACVRPDEPRFATITRMKTNGLWQETFARGIRNTVGYDWHPETKELWFTDNGRDHLGDNLPPDELNCAHSSGMHFGFPYRYGNNIADPEFRKEEADYKAKLTAKTDFTPPAMPLGAHVAALGVRFYTGSMFPAKYKNNMLICEHGSWNRSTKSGYRISMVKISGRKGVTYEPFIVGFLEGQEPWGRPVDLELLPDGSLLVSDDYAGAIYRITHAQ